MEVAKLPSPMLKMREALLPSMVMPLAGPVIVTLSVIDN